MKKLLLFLVTFTLFFTLVGCTGDEITTITDSIDAVEADVVTVNGLIDAVEADIVTAEANIVAANTEITALETAVNLDTAANEAAIDALEVYIDAEIAAIEVKLATIDDLIVGLTEDVAVLRTDITTNTGAIATNAGAITANEAAIALNETAIVDLDARIVMLEGYVATLMLPEVSVGNWKDMLTTEIVFMFNNDVHGRVNDDSWAGSMGYATIKNVIDEVRANYENTFLIAAGDMFHGTTFATLEQGESVVEVMNAVGYDIMVPGNHDFDYGQEQLLVLEGLADFPLISGNIQYAADDADMFDATFIQEFGDVKVGFFGITTPDTTYMTHPDNVIGLNFLDPIAQATLLVAELEAAGADIIVMMAHVGLDTSSSVTSADIAMAVDGIDIIIDGHSHSYLPAGEMVNGALVVSTGEYNKNLGILEITVEDGEIIEYNNLLINADEAAVLDLGSDETVQGIIDAIEVDQLVILGVVVGQTAVELDGLRDNVRTGETNLGKIITDSMIAVTGADIAITNGGGIRASIAAGTVTVGDIITVLPFGNIIVTVGLTGQEIVDTLEYATSSYPVSSGKFSHVSGVTFDIDMNNAEGSRVTNVMIGGVAIVLGDTYSVATNDFMAAGGDGYDLLGAAAITGEFMGLHEALEDMFTIGVDITIPADTRITVIPVTP